jgi:hypothetical protein
MPTSQPQAPPPAAQSAPAAQTFRSPVGVCTGVVSLAVVLWLGISAVVSTDGDTPWKSLAGLLLILPLLFAFTLRPAVFADDHRLRVRNPFRTVTLPWGAVSGLRAGHSNEVFALAGVKYQLWALPVSARGVRQAGYEQMRMIESSMGPGGRPLNRHGLFDAGRPDEPSAEAGRLRPKTGRIMESLRALHEAGATTKEAEGRPEVRWAYEIIVPAAVGLVLLTMLLVV